MADIFDLRGKNILITGASSRLGRAMAYGLAGHGGRVFITGRDLEKCQSISKNIGEKQCMALSLDVSSDESVEKAFIQTEIWGGVDVLINNATAIANGRLDEMSYEMWQKGIDGTLGGMFRTTRQALKTMLPKGAGNIISIASMYGIVSPDPGIYGALNQNNPPGYGAGMAAVMQLTRYIACHYGTKGIRANTVSPGPFPSEAAQKNEEYMQRLSQKTALGRVGRPDEISGAVIFLASDASTYVTGQNISVDGGWTAW